MSTSLSDQTKGDVPERVAWLASIMAGYSRQWALCGGWAIDAWLGRISRDHGDVDLSVFAADHQQLATHLDGWQLIAHTSVVDDGSTGLWDGRRLPVPSHIHARSPDYAGPLPDDGVCEPAKGWWLDIQIDDRDGDEWVLWREPRVSLPLRDAIVESPWGLPTASPEIMLFFKARDLRRRDKLDFVRTLPYLGAQQRNWLHDALSRMPHPWLAQLITSPSPA